MVGKRYEVVKIKMLSYIFTIFSKLPVELQLFISDVFFYRLPINFIFSLPNTDYKGYFKYALPKKNDVVIDGGGYLGNFSVLASRIVGKKGKVITFEPDGKYCEIIRKRIKMLGIKNITVYQYGLFNKRKQMSFEGTAGAGSLVLDKKTTMINGFKVNCIDMDSFVIRYKIPKINFIKMDIEGAEIEAIEGMKKVLKKFHPDLAIASYHLRNGKQTAEIIEGKLKKYKYKLVKTDYKSHLTTFAIN
jgi:FkbM family methyltransferase